MQEYRDILVPVDGSELSKKALRKALSLAGTFEGKVTALHVEEPIKGSWGTMGMESIQPSEEEYQDIMDKESKKILGEADIIARENGIAIKTVHQKGHAANEIVNASKHYDLIVMGTHGRSGLEHLLIGSVAEKVARHACCPVLLIREKPCEIK